MVRQTSNKVGIVGMVNHDTGRMVREAPVTFTFSWPYVEMTSNTKDGKIFITTFPDNSSNAELYQYNANLEFEHSWPDTDFWFFDLQYCVNQHTLYGIKVTSSYGRTLSRFDAAPEQTIVNATELFTLPYMWYVNASSFDQTSNRYFGLINYFPGHPESVLDQQLVTCDFTADADCRVIAIDNTYGILHFISYGMSTKELYYASMQDTVLATGKTLSTFTIGVLDSVTGKVNKIWSHSFSSTGGGQYQLLGPLVFEESDNSLSLFMRESVVAPWQLVKIPVAKPVMKVVATYDNLDYFAMFSAATKF